MFGVKLGKVILRLSHDFRQNLKKLSTLHVQNVTEDIFYRRKNTEIRLL